MNHLRISRITFFFLAVGVTLSGCTPEKARSLQIAAVQFKAESVAAIQAIEEMHRRELELPPQLQEKARNDFIDGVLNPEVQINNSIDVEKLTQINSSARPAPEWDTFVADLNNQYSQFEAIFNDLEKGSFLAAQSVKKSAQPAQILTVQMALFANEITENPPQLYRYRTAHVVKLRKLRSQYQQRVENQASEQEIQQLRNQVGDLMDEWQQIESDEQELLIATVAQCTKAATLGTDLSQLIERYDKLNLSDLNSIIATVLEKGSSITGRDSNQLKLQVTAVNNAINQDATLKTFADGLLEQVGGAVNGRGVPAERRTSQEIRQLEIKLIGSRQ